MRSITLISSLGLILGACSDSTSAPLVEDPPSVVALAADAHGPFDGETYKVTCLLGPDGSPVSSDTCPVVQWDGFAYWALAFHDNRSSMAIHAFDGAGNLASVVEQVGARYVYAIDVDDTAETVTFRGQADRTVTMTWDELRALR